MLNSNVLTLALLTGVFGEGTGQELGISERQLFNEILQFNQSCRVILPSPSAQRCKPSRRLNFEFYFLLSVLLTTVAGICRLSLLPALLIAFLNVSFGKHFTFFTISALGDISPCFLRFFGNVNIASTIIVAECSKQRFTLWQSLFLLSLFQHPVASRLVFCDYFSRRCLLF